jgi:thiol-disulfide isomerase/thioredoxin
MKTLLALTLLAVFVSCQPKTEEIKSTKVVFAGEVENSDDRNALLYMTGWPDRVKLDSSAFRFDVDFERPSIFEMRLAGEYLYIYAAPGDSINISFDKTDVDNSIRITGSHTAENELLRTFIEQREELDGGRRALYTLNEAGFLAKTDSIKTALHGYLESALTNNPDLEADFVNLMRAEIDYDRALKLVRYKNMYSRMANDSTYTESEDLVALKNATSIEHPEYLGAPAFRDFVLDQFYSMVEANDNGNDDSASFLTFIEQDLNGAVNQQPIEDYMKFSALKMALNYFDMERSMTISKAFIQATDNAIYKDDLEKTMARWEPLKAGNAAPSFKYPDINNQLHALADFKGKYVYIDVWATWCVPCLQEQPHLAKLEEKYHDNPNIVFMGISTDQDRAAWEKMVVDRNLGGVQLIHDIEYANIREDYIIEGIPRFILIDKEGNLIDSRAPRPSSDEIKELLAELLGESSPLLGYTN